MRSLLLALLTCALWAQDLRIGIIGDQTGYRDLAASYRVLERGVERLKREKPHIVIHTGDLVESTRAEDEVRANFQQAARTLDQLGVPWHLAPGDHDVNPPQYQPDSQDRSRERLFHDLYRIQQPGLEPFLAHSTDVRGYRLIFLNALEHLHTDPRWGNVFLARLSDTQTTWLKRELARPNAPNGTVVVLHQPLWYNWAGWQPVHDLLRASKVRAVIAGHFHYNQDEGERDGIRYLVAGPTGGALQNRTPSSGGFDQVAVVQITRDRVIPRAIPLDGSEPAPFLARSEADPLQALDMLLGEQYAFPSHNTACLRDSKLADADGGEVEIRVGELANPIASPISIRISPPEPPFRWRTSAFAERLCSSSTRDTCTLEPGTRVAVSNPSSLTLQPGRPTSWTAILESDSPLSPGSRLRFSISLTLQQGDGPARELRRTLELPLAPCRQ